jgi:hypothetical protein
LNLINKINNLVNTFYKKLIYYGVSVAFWDLFSSQKHRLGRFANSINRRKHTAIIKWLKKKYNFFFFFYKEQYLGKVPLQNNVPKQIWICWWDGLDDMPPLVRACFNSVKKNAGENNINFITKYNFHEFIAIADHVLEKFASNIITKTHLSDILRMALLAKYGGLWLDATILVTKTIIIEDKSFFTIKKKYGGEDIPRQRWTGFCISGIKDNALFVFVQNFFYEYWKKNNYMIDYFLIDYVIALAHMYIPEINQMIENVPLNNPDLYIMQENLGNEIDNAFWDKICENTAFHKLTWKQSYPIMTSKNKPTLYGYILDKYSEY